MSKVRKMLFLWITRSCHNPEAAITVILLISSDTLNAPSEVWYLIQKQVCIMTIGKVKGEVVPVLN
jgi:hypothetical protein